MAEFDMLLPQWLLLSVIRDKILELMVIDIDTSRAYGRGSLESAVNLTEKEPELPPLSPIIMTHGTGRGYKEKLTLMTHITEEERRK